MIVLMITRVGVGVDSHRFISPSESQKAKKPLILGGVLISQCGSLALEGNSDADVVIHAITDAISGITGRNIIGEISDKMAQRGQTSSAAYLELAVKDLDERSCRIVHVSISIEAARPRLEPHLTAMRKHLSGLLNISISDIGITATSGEGLSAFGKGLGIKAIAVVTSLCGQI